MLCINFGVRRLNRLPNLPTKVFNFQISQGDRNKEVPIHDELKKLIEDLKNSSQDGYLLSGLSEDKDGKRSGAIGKRFGRLKNQLGFERRYVFHSFRKTVVTLLEQAGISENLAAYILGHQKPRITYGSYIGGSSLEQKLKAINTINYY